MKILIVDDDKRKVDKIREVISEWFLDVLPNIAIAPTLHDAASALQAKQYDLMLLDLNLPVRPGEGPRPESGFELLRRLRENSKLRRPSHIIGLTSFDELRNKFAAEFARETWYLISFSDSSDVWKDQLVRKLAYVSEAIRGGQEGRYDTDIAILTAIPHVEFESVLKLPANWQRQDVAGDSTPYHRGSFEGPGGKLSVVAAASTEMGMAAAAAMSMKMITTFRPRYIAMVGIAAGFEGNFGDILIADQCWDMGSGKIMSDAGGDTEFAPAPNAIPLDNSLKALLALSATNRTTCDGIQNAWPDARAQRPRLEVQMGPFVSGAAVLARRDAMVDLRKRHRKLVAVEMETYGVFTAARFAASPAPLALSIKSICDFGTEKKDDTHQAYAAFTSAQYLYHFTLQYLLERCA